MFAEILRFSVAAYFLFSGINKLFFFIRFSDYLDSLFNLPGSVSFFLAGTVITLEILFAVVVMFWKGTHFPRVFALALALPFIAYNLWIFFVLGLGSCHCAYSPSGESLTSPLFSIAVLLATVTAVFFFTSNRSRSMRLPAVTGVFLLMASVIGGANALIWYQYQTSDLTILHSLIAKQLDERSSSEKPRYEVFIQLAEGRPYRAAPFFEKYLHIKDDSAVYILRTESAMPGNEAMPDKQTGAGPAILDIPEGSPLEHLGIQVYRDGTLIYRKDLLPEMTAAEFESFTTAIAATVEQFPPCDSSAAADELAKIVRRHVQDISSESPRIAVYLLMERACAECDADLLALLENYFSDTKLYDVDIAYFMKARPSDGRGVSIPPVELDALKHWCLYPHKLLLIVFGADDVAALPVPNNLEQLDQTINEEFERRGLPLFRTD